MARFNLFPVLVLALPAFAGVIDLAPGGRTEWQDVGAQVRHQTEYDAGLFGGIESIRIERVAFFSNGDRAGDTSTVTLRLSTLPFGSTLSRVAADNSGADVVTAYSGAWSGTSPEMGFTMWLDLTMPFLYDPSKGNLVMDLQNNGDSFLFPFGVKATYGLRSAHMLVGDTQVRDGDPFPMPGWVVQLGGTTTFRSGGIDGPHSPASATPEPGVAALVAAGLGLVCVRHRLRRRL